MTVCFCGCGERAVHVHHVCFRQHIPPATHTDERNLVACAFRCHGNHHAAAKRYRLDRLPDSVFVFAAEVLRERAHGYLRRRYAGEDPRLDALLQSTERTAA